MSTNFFQMSRIYPLIVFLFLTISCSKFTNSHSSETKWISIFDGKTLDKWELVGRDSLKLPYFWKVDNQILYCKTSGDKAHQGSWLVFHEKLSDFELKFKFRSNPNLKGNSGIQFRSQFDLEQNKMQVPQIDIHPPAPFRTGLIYDETDGVKHWLYPVTESWKLASFPMPKDWVYYKDSSKWNVFVLSWDKNHNKDK